MNASSNNRFLPGPAKFLLYIRIALHVAGRYLLRPASFNHSPLKYLRFLNRARHLLLVFRHNKVVRVANGYKLHLYLPAYPSDAFFHAVESKLITSPPGPTTIVLSITKACAYKCPHCYQRRDSGADIDEALLIKVAGQIRETGVAMFDIEGGEPFLRFPRLLHLIQSLDARSEVWVNTTGSGVTAESLSLLKDAGLFGLMISIHSPDPAEHDAFTGIPNSFQIACKALRLCRQMDLCAAVNSVLSEDQLRQDGLAALMNLTRDLGCDFVQLIHPKAAGTWLGRRNKMQTEVQLQTEIQRQHLRYNSDAMRSYPSLAAQVFEESEAVLGCTAGAVDRFYLNAHGEVQPCEFLNISFGNVNDQPFGDIYQRMRSHFSVPCSDWLCCTQAGAIHELFLQHGGQQTPLPWSITRTLVQDWNRGRPTPVYRKMGIYSS